MPIECIYTVSKNWHPFSLLTDFSDIWWECTELSICTKLYATYEVKGVGKKGPGKKGPGKKGPVKTVPVKTVLGKKGPGKKGPCATFSCHE